MKRIVYNYIFVRCGVHIVWMRGHVKPHENLKQRYHGMQVVMNMQNTVKQQLEETLSSSQRIINCNHFLSHRPTSLEGVNKKRKLHVLVQVENSHGSR